MAILTLEDLTGSCEGVMFSDCFTKYGHLAELDKTVFVLGKVDTKKGEPQIIIDRIAPIDCVPLEPGRVRLFVDQLRLNGGASSALTRVADLVRINAAKSLEAQGSRSSEERPVIFPVEVVIGSDDSVATLAADSRLKICPDPALFSEIVSELGEGMIRVSGVVVEKEKERKWQKYRPQSDDE
jgi:DNA polymerase III alpha subunit